MKSKIAKLFAFVLVASMMFVNVAFAAEEQEQTDIQNTEGLEESTEENETILATFEINGTNVNVTSENLRIGVDEDTNEVTRVVLTLEGCIDITENNLEEIIPQFLKLIADEYSGAEKCTIQFYYSTPTENRNNCIKIGVNTEAVNLIQQLKEKGTEFVVNMGTKNGGAVWYSNIHEATTLGFDEHDYISDTHWDFYGSGFTFKIMEYPYYGDGKPEFWLKTDENQMQKLDADKIEYYKEYQDVTLNADITYPGLHLLIPAQSNDNVSIEVNEDADLTATIIPYIDSTAQNVVVELPKKENNDNQYSLDSAIFSKLAEEKGKELTIVHDEIAYEFEEITNGNIGFTVGAEEKTTEVKQQLDTVVYAIDFKHSGELPGKASVTINVELKDGAYTWSYYDGANLTESVNVTVLGGKVTVPLYHCSTYVLTEGSTGGSGNNTNTGGNTNTGNSSGSSSSGSGSGDSAEASESQNTPVETYEAPASTVSQQLVNVPQTADTFPMTLLLMAAAVCMLALGVTYGKSKKEI